MFDAAAPMKTHTEGIQWMLKALTDPEKGAVKSMDEITAVGHRVLHGGERFTGSVLVNGEAVKDAIRENIPLGPLHNPANLMGIEACEKVMPTTPNVAVFDTAFHQTMPKKSLPVRRAHGVLQKAARAPLRLPRHQPPLCEQACL